MISNKILDLKSESKFCYYCNNQNNYQYENQHDIKDNKTSKNESYTSDEVSLNEL